jgi:CHASE2 domain-containing sensor protein
MFLAKLKEHCRLRRRNLVVRQRGNDIVHRSNHRRRANQAAWLIAIVIVSAAAGMICVWLAPGLDAYARDCLMQARGSVAPPDDIVIVAIDEASIARFGRFLGRVI